MGIQYPGDFPPPEDTDIRDWVDNVLPAKIAAIDDSVSQFNDLIAEAQRVENVFFRIYTHLSNITHAGMFEEARWLLGSTFTITVPESLVVATAANPLASAFFPVTNVTPDPLQISELTGIYDLSLGANELQGLQEELNEYLRIPPPLPQPDPATLLAAREKQRDAINLMIPALNLQIAELDPGDVGYSNAVRALADANIALTRVLNLIGNPSFYTEAERKDQIDDRVNGGSSYSVLEPLIGIFNRNNQINADKLQYVTDRYFWFRKRLNLQWGSLYNLTQYQAQVSNLTTEKLILQTELAYYISLGA